MSEKLDSIFSVLLSASQEAMAKNNKCIAIDCAYEFFERWSSHDYQQVLDKILELVEKFPDLDYGGPGPFGSFIETQPVGVYSHKLIASLQRRPSVQVLGWLDRTMRMGASRRKLQGGIEPSAFVDVAQAVIRHPLASDNCKSFAQLCLDG